MRRGRRGEYIMRRQKSKTYVDKLMEDDNFREGYLQEYKNLALSEKIAEMRHKANLTQKELAEKIHTTRSAISRYENADYNSYSIPLLTRMATACGSDIEIRFKSKGKRTHLAGAV